MRDKKKMYITIAIILIAIVVLFIIINVRKNRYNSQDGSNVIDEAIYDEAAQNNGVADYPFTVSDFIMVKRIVTKYFVSCTEYSIDHIERGKEKVFNMLDKKYVEEFGVTLDNVANKIVNNSYDSVQIRNMYEVRGNDLPTLYIVYGVATDIMEQKTEDFKMAVIVDKNTEKASILLEDYLNAHGLDNVQLNQQIALIEDEVTNDNVYYYEYIGEEAYAEYMFNEFKDNIMFFPELAYEHMSQEYKNSNSLNDFKAYINANRRGLYIMKYSNFLKEGNTYKMYNDYNQIFKFEVTSPMMYSVTLPE